MTAQTNLIKVAHYKSQGVFTAKAYVLWNDGLKTDFATATEENLADATEKAVRKIVRNYQNDGLTPPGEILKVGKQPIAFCDAWLF